MPPIAGRVGLASSLERPSELAAWEHDDRTDYRDEGRGVPGPARSRVEIVRPDHEPTLPRADVENNVRPRTVAPQQHLLQPLVELAALEPEPDDRPMNASRRRRRTRRGPDGRRDPGAPRRSAHRRVPAPRRERPSGRRASLVAGRTHAGDDLSGRHRRRRSAARASFFACFCPLLAEGLLARPLLTDSGLRRPI